MSNKCILCANQPQDGSDLLCGGCRRKVGAALQQYAIGADLVDYARELGEWSEATFGSGRDRGPAGPLAHLAEEALEAAHAIGTDEFIEELSDCFALVDDARRRAGITIPQLLAAAKSKLEKNRARQWCKAEPFEPVHHVKPLE